MSLAAMCLRPAAEACKRPGVEEYALEYADLTLVKPKGENICGEEGLQLN